MLQEHRLGIGAAHQACQRLHGRCSKNGLCVFARHSQQRINASCRLEGWGFWVLDCTGSATGLSSICSSKKTPCSTSQSRC